MYDYGMIDIMYHMFRPTIDGIITRYSDMDEAAYIVLGLASVVFIAGAFTHHKLWLKTFDPAILMMLWQSKAVDYTLVYFVPVMILMMIEEEIVTRDNIIPVAFLMLLVVAYPTTYLRGSRYLTLFHSDIVQAIFVLMLVAEGLRLILMWIKHMDKRIHVII